MTTMSVISKQNDLFGTDVYRDGNKALPLAYRPSATMTVEPSKRYPNKNHNVKINSTFPVVINDGGRMSSEDKFVASTSFTGLQAVVADSERANCLKTHIAFLITGFDSIISGQLPDSGLDISVALSDPLISSLGA